MACWKQNHQNLCPIKEERNNNITEQNDEYHGNKEDESNESDESGKKMSYQKD